MNLRPLMSQRSFFSLQAAVRLVLSVFFTLSAGLPPRIEAQTVSIRRAVLVELATRSDPYYQLQVSIDLKKWTDVGIPFQGDGGVFSFAFSSQEISSSFYHFLEVGPLALQSEFVTVSDENNSSDILLMEDDGTGAYGAIAYRYRVGKYEVTNNEYAAFLNAAAKTDPHGLYKEQMTTSDFGGIVRNGTEGNFAYAVKSLQLGYDRDYLRKPVLFVSLYDCLRFCNWLHNGATSSSSTENGAYDLTQGYQANAIIPRTGVARYFLLSESEWYKAAYYKHGSSNGGYWLYPTKSDTAPVGTNPSTSQNAGNIGSAVGFLTDVGSYPNSASPYGTFDQGGNVLERLENGIVRGGSFENSVQVLRSVRRLVSWNTPLAEARETGFRIGTRTDFPPLRR